MPYSIPLIPDRKAVGQVTYQLRRFVKQLREMEIDEPFKSAIIENVGNFENMLKGAVIDYDDDGTVLEGSPDNRLILGEEPEQTSQQLAAGLLGALACEGKTDLYTSFKQWAFAHLVPEK